MDSIQLGFSFNPPPPKGKIDQKRDSNDQQALFDWNTLL